MRGLSRAEDFRHARDDTRKESKYSYNPSHLIDRIRLRLARIF
uniref:Uncharacterized protein n=1 Tax=Candidatus Kentrum sp. FW TaxID=2126338 RepID=A0A450SY98_9GAMM|nr:MAG: hypothetical protein BECKFW1821B_GA0114236_104613 [Candidatus Kentron sp. FW]